MNEYDLFDALCGIDEDLLERSERKTHRRFSPRKLLIAAAAVMLLVVTAMATPAIRELIFAKGSELVSEGFYITLEKLGIIDSYVPASYEVSLEVPNTPEIPEYIQDYRVPTYFVEHGWIMDHIQISSSTEPDAATMLFFAPDNPVPQVSFQQHIFYPSDNPEVLHYFFSMSGSNEDGWKEEPVTVGDQEATLYNGRTIIWTDGQYAYELNFHYDVAPAVIEDVVLSLESVDLRKQDHVVLEDIFSDKYKTPIEAFYTLGKVPTGFALTKREWDVNNAAESYMLDADHFLTFAQCVIQSEENLGPTFSVEDSMLGLAMDKRPFTSAEYIVDSVQITIIRENGAGPLVMWNLDKYCFRLSFSYDPGLTDEALLDFYRSVQPMPDFTDHLIG